MTENERRLKEAWNQRVTPVALRRTGDGERTRVRLPGQPIDLLEERVWLLNDRKKHYLEWNCVERCWELPKKWFNDFVERALVRFGKLYIIQPFIETETCARACMQARGHECNCSCMGQNHGAGMHGWWFEVSETFAVCSLTPQLAGRLLTRTNHRS